jgi:hypothetical protein
MRIEIELHEAQSDDGEVVRLRIVREWREHLDGGEQSVTLVRDHDRGTDLHAGSGEDLFVDAAGRSYRLMRRLV